MQQVTLNPQQELAAKHMEGPLLVLAGAGSGKTRVVTYRILHLLEIGVPSSQILALTFTNKAADEMRHRIQRVSNQYVLTSTFHSLGAKILRESISALGYRNDFTIYDEDDSLSLLKNCLATLGAKEEKGLAKSLRIAISNLKNDLLSPSDLKKSFHTEKEQLLPDLFTLYQERLKEYNALDFEDLLYLTVKLFQSSKERLEIYQKRWRFILIDEYQDTNKAQYLMTKLLAARHNNVFAVGDPDQSIYSWRGATIRNILDFESDYPGAEVITLEQNYRSVTNILEAANALIQHNEKRYEKKLWSDLGAGEKIRTFIAENEREEAKFVIDELTKRAKKEKIPLNECVIFYRTNAQSRSFEDVFISRQVPYIIIGGISFYERREIKDILAWLRITVSPSDFLAFMRTINLPRRGLGSTTISKWRDLAEKQNIPILTLCRRLLEGEGKLSKKQKEGICNYFKIVDSLKKMHETKAPLQKIIKATIDHSSYLDILKQDPETFEDRKGNLEELINKGAELAEERESMTLTQFLEELALKSTLDDTLSHESVRLMTLHNGKGLEFSLVFIVGMEEDLFPHIHAKDSIEALEEERRLCYVGMTRAKLFLYLTASVYRLIWGASKEMCPSRFLGEIPSRYLLELTPLQEEENDEEEMLPIGTVVSHKDFGKGIIKKAYHTSLGVTYDVHFIQSNFTRSLVDKYAKLKIHS
jgi:DNA helicase-2/ATP-dependent DNA helicase PcrA